MHRSRPPISPGTFGKRSYEEGFVFGSRKVRHPKSQGQNGARINTTILLFAVDTPYSKEDTTIPQYFLQLNFFPAQLSPLSTRVPLLPKAQPRWVYFSPKACCCIWVFSGVNGHLNIDFLVLSAQYKLKKGIMCFIKKVELDLEPVIYPCERQCCLYGLPFAPSHPYLQSYLPPMAPALNFPLLLQQMAADISGTVDRINANNLALYSFAQKLIQSQKRLEEAALDLQQNMGKSAGRTASAMTLQPHCELNDLPFPTQEPILGKIFGQREYKFKLSLAQSFPRIIYKQRNLNIPVKICNPTGESLFNANLIHLCIGVCNSYGQWIVEESGDFFIQGKIEIDIYHGEAEFKKVSPKDVSRHFNGGVVNIVIYPKKSLVNFTGEVTKYEKIIDPDLIQPLIIKDVLIKAKKKSKH